jgi:Zn-finger nucleic acid-binding protein
MSQRDCPDCGTRMQAFWAPPRRGGEEIELDRCNECGGVWFDAGELLATSGRVATSTRDATDRLCPVCHVELELGRLNSGVEVETCPRCRGTFLEARDLEAIARRTPSRGTSAMKGGAGFVCEGCGERRPFSQGEVTLTGLECRACVEARKAPPPEASQVEAASFFGRFLAWFSGE